MNYKLLLNAGLFTICIAQTAWGQSEITDLELTTEEINWFADNKIIYVGVDPDATPFEFIDQNGDIGGVAGDYLSILSQKLNVEFVWSENQNWDEAISFIRSGKAQILSTVTPTDERREYLNFIELYHTVGSTIFVKSGEQRYNSLESLSGRKIAQVKNFAETEFIQKDFPEIEIIEVTTTTEALNMISTGEADAHVGNMIIGLEIIKNEGLNNIIVGGDSPFQGTSNIAVRKDLLLLNSALEKAIATITETEHDKIAEKWLSIPLTSEIDYTLIWRIVVVSSLILLITVAWAMSLRREVKKRIRAEHKMSLLKVKAEEAQGFAEGANKAKSNFISNLSHEIRTPLTSMMVFSEAMSDGIFGEIKQPKYHEYLGNIRKSGKHLEMVITDILDLSKIEAEKWQLVEEEFELTECAVDGLQILQGKADKKEIKLSLGFENVNPPLIIYGENVSIRRIIINLLSNAIKFTERGGHVRCILTKEENGSVAIRIKDNGIGIKKEELDHVLEPFGQADSNVFTKDSGTGLGLAIVKKLVELHDGEIKLESEVGIGTTVTVILPKKRIV